MAHFAELDENNIVIRVLVVSNDDITDKNGVEQESLGVAFLQNIFGSTTAWKQTSYNNNFRGRYAGTAMIYDPVEDMFVAPEPDRDPLPQSVDSGS